MGPRPLPRERLGPGPLDAPGGLSAAEVDARRRRWGANDVAEPVVRPWWAILRETAADPMPWFLAVTAALQVALGDRLEAAALAGAVVPLVGMDVLLHRRTTASIAGLASALAAEACVVRDGVACTVPARDLVPGDLVRVAPGTPCPADGVLVGGAGVQVEESALTGEAWPVRKRVLDALPPGAAPAVDAAAWLHAGTRVLTGPAMVRVVHTGGDTLYGEIVRSAGEERQPRTPLQAAIAQLVATLTAGAAVLCVVLAVVRLAQGFGWIDAVTSAVTLAVAALPEEFPVVFTVFLGVGVHRLARRQALVRRAVSVENVGRVTAICSDKTGTITEGRLRVEHLLPADGVTEAALATWAARAAREDSGDPLDVALLAAAGPRPPQETLATFPFTEERRRETAVLRAADGTCIAVTKGAAETVLALTTLHDDARAAWEARVGALAATRHKVIAVAWRPLPDGAWAGGEPDRGFTLAGLVACEDPVRASVPAAVAACRAAGIHVVMVTGDHRDTACAVAVAIGLGDGAPRVVEGDALADLQAHDPAALRAVDVVARALPRQKLDLVRALQAAGDCVAVTGDGVNDVPALQAADVGIAIGSRAVRSAREAAHIVLLDDDFGTIVRAIAEGRALAANLRRSFRYLVAVHVPLVVSAAVVPLLGWPLLYLPLHIVWLELQIHPTAMLVFQAGRDDARLDARRPAAGRTILRAGDWAVLAVSTGLLTAAVLAGHARAAAGGGDVMHARAMALAILSFGGVAAMVALGGLRGRAGRLLALLGVAGTAALVQWPASAALLGLRPLHADDWGLAVAAAAAAAVPLLPWPLMRREGRSRPPRPR